MPLIKALKGGELLLGMEDRRKWKNRETLLNKTIQNMRFVKIEFLSQMRRFQKRISFGNKIQKDNVSVKASGLKKENTLKFPHDGVLFGDELFHLTSDVKDLCLRSQK